MNTADLEEMMNTVLNDLFNLASGLLRAGLTIVGGVAEVLESDSKTPVDDFPASMTYTGKPSYFLDRSNHPLD